jgi:hypothetical protein
MTPGCPACDQLAAARNQAIAHLSEALYLLAGLRKPEDRATLRLSLHPTDVSSADINSCHSIDLTPKQAEALADAIDSMNAYLGTEPTSTASPTAAVAGGAGGEAIPTGDYSAAAVAQNNPDLYADVTDLFLAIDPLSYLDDVINADCPEAAQAAYEQLVTGEWDGEL